MFLLQSLKGLVELFLWELGVDGDLLDLLPDFAVEIDALLPFLVHGCANWSN
jgi:hypothetical protein